MPGGRQEWRRRGAHGVAMVPAPGARTAAGLTTHHPPTRPPAHPTHPTPPQLNATASALDDLAAKLGAGKLAALLGSGADKLELEASDIELIEQIKAVYATPELPATFGDLPAAEGQTDLVGTTASGLGGGGRAGRGGRAAQAGRGWRAGGAGGRAPAFLLFLLALAAAGRAAAGGDSLGRPATTLQAPPDPAPSPSPRSPASAPTSRRPRPRARPPPLPPIAPGAPTPSPPVRAAASPPRRPSTTPKPSPTHTRGRRSRLALMGRRPSSTRTRP